MANVSKKGLTPVGMIGGGDWRSHVMAVHIPSSDSTAMGIGDPVTLTGTANTAPVTNLTKYDIGTLPEVIIATAGDDNPVLGAVVGFEHDPDDRNTQYRKASTSRVAFVTAHPDIVYEGQCDSTLGAAAVNLNTNLVSGSLDTVNGVSGWLIDSTATADESNQLQILRVSPDLQSNDTTASGTRVLVRISRHCYNASTGEGLGL